jgi:hypothetical protein
MRFRDIKVGQEVRVKNNAEALTKEDSRCFSVDDDSELKELQGKIGTVEYVDNGDKTIKVHFDDTHSYSWYFDSIHLEPVPEIPVSVATIVSSLNKEDLELTIAELNAKLATAIEELKTLKNIFSIKDMFSSEREDGVYSISGTTSKCIITDGVPLFVSSSCIEPLDAYAWDSDKFTLTTLQPRVTFE